MSQVKMYVVKENERVYNTDYGIPTIAIGDGGTCISNVIGEDFAGICFGENTTGSYVVGKANTQDVGKFSDELPVFLQIITRNPASLDVIIGACEEAKLTLQEMQKEGSENV